MRERLAVARSRSKFLVCAAAANGEALGNLILRGIDNGDGDALRRAKWALSLGISRRYSLGILKGNQIAADVLRYLHDQRCTVCMGRMEYADERGVHSACLACNGTGYLGYLPNSWRKYHLVMLTDAQKRMGKALASAREAVQEG